MRDFISLADLSPRQWTQLLHLSREVKSRPSNFRRMIPGKSIVLIFEKPSLRTRLTFELGAKPQRFLQPEQAEGLVCQATGLIRVLVFQGLVSRPRASGEFRVISDSIRQLRNTLISNTYLFSCVHLLEVVRIPCRRTKHNATGALPGPYIGPKVLRPHWEHNSAFWVNPHSLGPNCQFWVLAHSSTKHCTFSLLHTSSRSAACTSQA